MHQMSTAHIVLQLHSHKIDIGMNETMGTSKVPQQVICHLFLVGISPQTQM